MSTLACPPPCLWKTWDRGDSRARCGERRDYLATGAVFSLTPVDAQAGGVQSLGLSLGGDGDGGTRGNGGQGPAGEERVREPGLVGVVSPSLLRGQGGGDRGRALQVSYTVVQGGADTPIAPAPDAAVYSGQVENGASRVEGCCNLL